MKKLLAIVLAVLMLAGCQLASDEKNADAMEDKLVGVFVTFDHLDLDFDIEGYLSDNAQSIVDGDEIVLDPGEGMEYRERLYAEVTKEGWSFPGHEGLIMGQMWKEDHWAGFSTEGFCERKTHVTQTDTLDGIEEEGTIYVPNGSVVLFCSNPVYMTPEGEYYVLPGDGFQSSVDSGSMSQSVSDEKTWTTDGEEYTYSAKFTTTVQGVKLADKVTVVQMSADHAELSRAEYVPGEMPGSITPEAGTAYLIVEESAEGETTRNLYQPGDDSIQVFYQDDQVYCLPQFTEVNWPE